MFEDFPENIYTHISITDVEFQGQARFAARGMALKSTTQALVLSAGPTRQGDSVWAATPAHSAGPRHSPIFASPIGSLINNFLSHIIATNPNPQTPLQPTAASFLLLSSPNPLPPHLPPRRPLAPSRGREAGAPA
jgi:hypothetical protein